MTEQPRLILASASPRRLDLLKQIGVTPDEVFPADIDEAPLKGELPGPHAVRLASEKGRVVSSRLSKPAYVLSGDTVVGVGRRILPKTETEDEIRQCLGLMSGRAHRVYTAIALTAPDGQQTHRNVMTRVRMKRLDPGEIDAYILSGEGIGKAGGYGIQGLAGAYISEISGSYTGVVGLPVHETYQLLKGAGFLRQGS